MTAIPDLRPGLGDPVLDSQAVFRAVLKGMSFPGRIQALPVPVDPPAPLHPAAAAILLTLADLDAPVWLAPELTTEAVAGWLRFHAGCPVAADRGAAAFAVIGPAETLDGFALGSPEFPERSATAIVQVPDLAEAPGLILSGPGIRGTAALAVPGLGRGIPAALRENRALFPEGIDLILAAPDRFACLPRTTLVTE